MVHIRCTTENGLLPIYGSSGASGADLAAALDAPMVLAPGERRLVPTGLRVEIPYGYELQIRPRSGLALEHGVTVLNSPGTVDSDYRGELKVLLVNLGEREFTVRRGDRIAQAVVVPVARARFVVTGRLADSDRGGGGFGSTGRGSPATPS
jgi:dUTP pyrophosphatase